MKEQKSTIVAIILIIIVAVIAFWGGIAFQRVHSNRAYSVMPGSMNGFGQGRFMGRPMMGFGTRSGQAGFARGAVNGTVTNISGNQVTVKLPNGITRTVNLSSTTQYLQTSTASQNSLSLGQNVTIMGQGSQNGSLSAQTVTINPQ